jgi:hypothetical protein
MPPCTSASSIPARKDLLCPGKYVRFPSPHGGRGRREARRGGGSVHGRGAGARAHRRHGVRRSPARVPAGRRSATRDMMIGQSQTRSPRRAARGGHGTGAMRFRPARLVDHGGGRRAPSNSSSRAASEAAGPKAY